MPDIDPGDIVTVGKGTTTYRVERIDDDGVHVRNVHTRVRMVSQVERLSVVRKGA